MAYEFKLSDIGDNVDEAEILKWMVGEGDGVREDDPVVEVETERAIIEIPSPVGGRVSKIHADEGETVPVGATVATIDTDEDGEAERDDESVEILDSEGNTAVDVDAEGIGEESVVEGAEEDDTVASPSTRLLAREVGVDLRDVEGSGEDGRVLAQDILRAAKRRQEEREAADERADGDEGGDENAMTAEDESHKGAGYEGAEEAGVPTASGSDGGEGMPKADAPEVDPETTDETTMFGGGNEEETEDAAGVSEEDPREQEGTRKEASVEETDNDELHEGHEGHEAHETHDPRAEETETETDAPETDDADEEETAERPTVGSETESVPYSGARRRVGERLRKVAEGPLVTHHDTADAERLVEVRERLRGETDERLTYTPFLVKACCVALEEHRAFNAEIDAETGEVRLRDEMTVGVATGVEEGVRFPVVDSVDDKGVAEIAAEVGERSKTTQEEEPPEGMFTVYNVGAVGGEWTTALPASPGAAAVAAGEIRERPRVVDGEVVARHTLPLSLTFDRRVADESAAARFTKDLMRYLNDPMEMLL